jgi:hypothetical protein
MGHQRSRMLAATDNGILAAIIVFIAALGAGRLHASGSRPGLAHPFPRSFFESRVDLAEEEQPRIRRHLRWVERRLRERGSVHLPPALARARKANLVRLHDYWVRGEFPRNLRFPGSPPPLGHEPGRCATFRVPSRFPFCSYPQSACK